jgi:hypothetical protein
MAAVPLERGKPEAAASNDVWRIINYPHATILQYLCRGIRPFAVFRFP